MKKTVKPAVRRELAHYAVTTHAVCLRRTCRVIGISDSVYRGKPDSQRNNALTTALQKTAERYSAYGFSNPSEFISSALADWAEQHQVQLEFIKPANQPKTCL